MGGNLTLIYLGKMHNLIAKEIIAGLAYSVPCDLEGAATELEKPINQIYMQRFLKDLHKKILAKKKRDSQ